MLISCGGRGIAKRETEERQRKIPRLTPPDLSRAGEWEYLAEGGANVVFCPKQTQSHEKRSECVLRVPKKRQPFGFDELYAFVRDSVLPVMNHDSHPTGGEKRYRLYGEVVTPASETFLDDLNAILGSAEHRPEHRRDSQLARAPGNNNETETSSSATETIPKLLLLPNVVDAGEICIELKPKSSLGFDQNTQFPSRYDGMAMKQRTCRYCMHQEFKASRGEIRRRAKEYCPMDLFSNHRGRMKMALRALLDAPQNNLKVFAPGGRDLTGLVESAAATRRPSPPDVPTLRDPTGMLGDKDALINVMVEALCESQVLNDLHRAHELDEVDIEGLWHLHQRIESSDNLDGAACHLFRDLKTHRWLSAIGCTDSSDWEDVRNRYQKTLGKFLLATTMKDCSLLISIRRQEGVPGQEQNHGPWSEMEYRIECNDHIYFVLISIIDLDMKPSHRLPKYYRLDQDIVHHYSETHGLHKKFCFGPNPPEDTFESHEDVHSVVQIKGNMMCRLLYPNPVCLLTVYDPKQHAANVMTISWLTAIDNHGSFVCSMSKRRYTSELLDVSSIFVLNIPASDLKDTILAIGSVSGRKTDKFRELGLRTCGPGWSKPGRISKKEQAITKHAIALSDCVAHTVCLVREKQDQGQHWLLVCKQQLAWSKKGYFADGKRFQRSSELLPPYLTFLGTQTFGSIV